MSFDDHVFSSTAGIDLGGSKMLIRYRDFWLRYDTGAGFDAARLTGLLHRFLASLAQAPAAIGIAVPGLVEGGSTVAACDVLPGLVGWNAREVLGTRLPWTLVNDAKAALHASSSGLPADGVAATVMAGSAVGCGIVVHGRVLGGACGWAGELGYWPLRSSGGPSLRLDEVAGGSAMAARLGIGGRELAARTLAGDPAACAVVAEGGRALGGALAGLVNLLNPHRLSIGGGALRLAGYWSAAEQALREATLPALLAGCELRLVHEVEDLVALGAAQMASALEGPA